MEGPQGSKMSYQIPALKLQDYTTDVMLERKQYILLPFLFFNYESQMENASDPDVFQEINGLFDMIIQRLQNRRRIPVFRLPVLRFRWFLSADHRSRKAPFR